MYISSLYVNDWIVDTWFPIFQGMLVPKLTLGPLIYLYIAIVQTFSFRGHFRTSEVIKWSNTGCVAASVFPGFLVFV